MLITAIVSHRVGSPTWFTVIITLAYRCHSRTLFGRHGGQPISSMVNTWGTQIHAAHHSGHQFIPMGLSNRLFSILACFVCDLLSRNSY